MVVGIIIAISLVIVMVAFALDHAIHRDAPKDELVADLHSNYLESLDIAQTRPHDSRLKDLSAMAAQSYYKKAIDGNILIRHDKIEEFIKTVCDVDLGAAKSSKPAGSANPLKIKRR